MTGFRLRRWYSVCTRGTIHRRGSSGSPARRSHGHRGEISDAAPLRLSLRPFLPAKNLPLGPRQDGRRDADGTAVFALGNRAVGTRIPRFEGIARQFVRRLKILRNFDSVSFQQSNQPFEVMDIGKCLTTLDKHGLNGLLRALLRIKTVVAQLDTGLKVTSHRQVALRSPNPLGAWSGGNRLSFIDDFAVAQSRTNHHAMTVTIAFNLLRSGDHCVDGRVARKTLIDSERHRRRLYLPPLTTKRS